MIAYNGVAFHPSAQQSNAFENKNANNFIKTFYYNQP